MDQHRAGTEAMMPKVFAFFRGATAILLFALFGVGGIVISPLMALLRKPEFCQPVVRSLWVCFVSIMRLSGIIGVEFRSGGQSIRGCVIAANHPSLIDVVLITALVPKTLFVAKPALLHNPCMAAIVRHATIPLDEHLPEVAGRYLKRGWNLLVFPEGTRSPESGFHPFHRGVAQLVLRTGAGLACIGMRTSRRILGKRQPPWDVGDKRVEYFISADNPTHHPADCSRALRPLAVRLTDEIRRRIETLAGVTSQE